MRRFITTIATQIPCHSSKVSELLVGSYVVYIYSHFSSDKACFGMVVIAPRKSMYWWYGMVPYQYHTIAYVYLRCLLGMLGLWS